MVIFSLRDLVWQYGLIETNKEKLLLFLEMSRETQQQLYTYVFIQISAIP